MARFDATSAECVVLVFKEGLLSKVAHDLKFRATDLSIEVDGETVTARFGAAGLRVLCVMRGGVEAEAPSARDKREIEQNLLDKVLEAQRYPEIRFRSTALRQEAGLARVEGTLWLHGVERALSLTAKAEGALWTAEVELFQPDFNIKPFSALLGTMKVKPAVRVRVRVPRT
jgi:hypothetical protein